MELGEFQTASLAIALVILVISLIAIGISLSKTSGIYPPTIDACPDYWSTSNYLSADVSKCNKTEFGCCSDYATPKEDADGSNCPVKCYNTHQLGKVSSTCTSIPTEMNFSDDVYTGSAGLCNKQKWASQCGITWDGVTDVANAC
jgi:hypothetical protein